MDVLSANYFSTIFLILGLEILRLFCALDTNSEYDHSFEINHQSGESRESLKEKYTVQNRSCSLEKASICFYALLNNITKNQSENLTETLGRCVKFGMKSPCIGKPCKTDCLLRGPQPLGEVKNLAMTVDGPKFEDGLTVTWTAFSTQKDLLYVLEYEEMVSETNREKKFEIMIESKHHFPMPSNCRSWNLHVKAVLNGSVVAVSEKVKFPVKYNIGINVTVDPEIHNRPTNTVMMEFQLSGLKSIYEFGEIMMDHGSISLIRFLSISDNLYVLLNDHLKTVGPHTESFIDDIPENLIDSGCQFYTIFVGSITFLNRFFCGVSDSVNRTIIMRLPYYDSSNKSCLESLRYFAEHQETMLIGEFDTNGEEMVVYDLPSETFISNSSILCEMQERKEGVLEVLIDPKTSNILRNRQPKFRLESREVQRINLRYFDEKKHPFRPPPPPLFLAYILPGFLTIVLCILILVYLRRKNKLSKMASSSKSNDTDLTILADKWELPRNRLLLEDKVKLGAGEFGAVYKAQMIKSDNQLVTVAVKTLTAPTTSLAKENFLEEIKLMKHLGYHERLANMIGCLTIEEPYYLIVEYCAGGDLHHFLRTKRLYMVERQLAGFQADKHFLSIEILLTIAWQVACGMEYMSQKQFIHRDLASRNVLLVDEDNVKIGDFGLSRHFQPENFYYTSHGGRLPIKWMALESLTEYKFTSASDVWSFGVLLFELITLGDGPYPEIDPHLMENYLKTGKRMAKPENCPDQLYDLMQSTWKSDPQDRPIFSEIKDSLKTMINDLKEFSYNYLTLLNNNNLYANLV